MPWPDRSSSKDTRVFHRDETRPACGRDRSRARSESQNASRQRHRTRGHRRSYSGWVGYRAVIVLDTHAWIWWVSEPVRLGKTAKREIHRAKRIGIPAICCLEVATLAARNRIALDRPTLQWLHDALALPLIDLLPITPAVAVKAVELPALFPGDPADRLVAATAILESALLITKDERMRESGLVRTAW